MTDEQYGGDWLVTKWIGEQLQRAHDKPFFLACGIYKPHEPWFVPEHYRRRYDPTDGQEQVISPYAELPNLPEQLVRRTRGRMSSLRQW